MRIKAKYKSVKKRIKGARKTGKYIKATRSPIDDKAFLLEAGQGKNINGNVFALLDYIRKQDRFDDYKVYLSLRNKILEDAEVKLAKYGIGNVDIVKTGSIEYKEVLATAKYLITDNSFPAYFYKRPEQVYINTWHGTPLKALGRTDIDNATSLANVQANMLKADYLLHPNEFTKNIMMKDYMVEKAFFHKTVIIDYPRNDALYKQTYRDEIVRKYDLEGKRIIAYMPTWRGVGRVADVDGQVRDIKHVISTIDSNLKENEILYINLHFLLGNSIDISEFENTRFFPPEYETYDFLALCDTLITDYSSVCIDFAGTGREVMLHMYDYEEYKANKGFYVDIREFPFKKSYTDEELIENLHKGHTPYEMEKQFVCENRGNSCAQVIELICDGKEEGLEIEDYSGRDKIVLAFFENITRDENQLLLAKYISELSEEDRARTMIAFQDKINQKTTTVLKTIDDDIDYMRFAPKTYKGIREYLSAAVYKKTGKLENDAVSYYRREAMRFFSHINVEEVQLVYAKSIDKILIFANAAPEKTLYAHPAYFYGRNGARMVKNQELYQSFRDSFDNVVRFSPEDEISFWEGKKCYGIEVKLDDPKYYVRGDDFCFSGNITVLTDTDFVIDEYAYISENDFPIALTGKYSKDGDITRYEGGFEINMPVEKVEEFHKHNRIFLKVRIADNFVLVPFKYQKEKHGPKNKFITFENSNVICIVRSTKRFLDFEIRERNRTDSKSEQRKLSLAKACSKLSPKKNRIVLWEKECSRYEESASCVFEKLIDSGHEDVRFILDKNYPFYDDIPEKYRKYIVDRFSFDHYYNIFMAKTFISTEALAHLLEPNTVSKVFKKDVISGTQNYVFLQHGVMYMVSLNAESRGFFRKISKKRKNRIVVSSPLEAKHFTDFTPYKPKDIYISGLPKFDKSVSSDDADLIVIMLTWRPWEYNQAVKDFEHTKYYEMLERLVASVPEEYRDRLVVLPHPKIAKIAENNKSSDVIRYSVFDEKYDDILKKTRVLITDYSSIAYDAFYRGANVIFCWGEKDYCMSEYGPSATLMLTEDLAFGPVAYDENIAEIIREQYDAKQREDFVENYSKIVQFHDNHNTDRVIEMMEEDEFL